MKLNNTYLEKLQANQLKDLAKFVVTENFKHHSGSLFPKNYKNDINAICNEELKYFQDSEIYVSKNSSGSIIGSIRVLKWNFIDKLPIQKIFGISPFAAVKKQEINNIYHIGRFAIKKNMRNVNLFKQLMVCAIAPICKHPSNVVIAECDSKLLRTLNILGIKTTVVGASKSYLGSETIPIIMTYDGLIDFYNNNKLLVDMPNEQMPQPYLLPKSVVFRNIEHSTL